MVGEQSDNAVGLSGQGRSAAPSQMRRTARRLIKSGCGCDIKHAVQEGSIATRLLPKVAESDLIAEVADRGSEMLRFVLLCALVLCSSAAEAAVIGEAASTKNQVTGQLQAIVRQLQSGDAVSASELVSTGLSSATVLKFIDDSLLNIGASSHVVLDKFVFNPDHSAKDVVINLTRGAMRFATGNSDSKNFTIRTPVATLGPRGTKVISICAGTRCIYLLAKGGVLVCPHPIENSKERCPDAYLLNEYLNFTFVGPNGVNSGPQHVSISVIDAVNNSIDIGKFINISDIGGLPNFGQLGPTPGGGGPPGGGINPIVLGAIPLTFGFIVLTQTNNPASP